MTDLERLAKATARDIRLTCAAPDMRPWRPGGQEDAEAAGFVLEALRRVEAETREECARIVETRWPIGISTETIAAAIRRGGKI